MFLDFVFINVINMFGTSYFNSWVTVTGSLIFFLCCAADPESVSTSPYFSPQYMEPVTGILLLVKYEMLHSLNALWELKYFLFFIYILAGCFS